MISPSRAKGAGRTPAAADFIAPGATLGVLGGGQLGRMFVHAAQRAGYRVAVLDSDAASPAGRAADEHIRADYLDGDGLARMSERCAAVTIEFENVPAEALARLGASVRVSPAADAVSVCQDRGAEKTAFARADVACAPHAILDTAADGSGVDPCLFPAVLKTTRLGYDGKGQCRLDSAAELASAFAALGNAKAILEKRLALAAEISVIVARGADGTCVHLPVQENLHRDGILARTRVPAAAVGPAQQCEAVALAVRMAESLAYIGVLCVEFFVLADGSLVANEMAPRPHNSGHYSIDACDLSQFDLQVRTLTGAPLQAPRLHSPCVMLNLMGDLWHASGQLAEPDWAAVLALPGAHLHLYGKSEARPGRKMGHLTLTAADADAAGHNGRRAAALLGLPAD